MIQDVPALWLLVCITAGCTAPQGAGVRICQVPQTLQRLVHKLLPAIPLLSETSGTRFSFFPQSQAWRVGTRLLGSNPKATLCFCPVGLTSFSFLEKKFPFQSINFPSSPHPTQYLSAAFWCDLPK